MGALAGASAQASSQEVCELFSPLYRKPADHEEPDVASPLPAHEVGESGGSSGPELSY